MTKRKSTWMDKLPKICPTCGKGLFYGQCTRECGFGYHTEPMDPNAPKISDAACIAGPAHGDGKLQPYPHQEKKTEP
jgi:hypothetical protein